LDNPEKVAAFDAFLTALENQPETWYATQGEDAIWSLLRKQTVISPASGVKNGKAFTLRHPWVHPYLRTTPLSVKVPEGVTSVIWNGTTLPVLDGWVDLSLESKSEAGENAAMLRVEGWLPCRPMLFSASR